MRGDAPQQPNRTAADSSAARTAADSLPHGRADSAAAQPPAPAPPRTVILTLRRSHSLEADRKRLAELVDLLEKYRGEDRFEIVIEANGKQRYQLGFPNNHTRVCRELLAELTLRLGAGGWKLEG